MFSCEFLWVSKNTIFYRTPSVAGSESSNITICFYWNLKTKILLSFIKKLCNPSTSPKTLWSVLKSFLNSKTFPYALFMSWINETSETSRNHYTASHQREGIKTKQQNELLIIISGYILFTWRWKWKYRNWNPFKWLNSITTTSSHALCQWKSRKNSFQSQG